MPRILVVEDNDLVGTTVCRALRSAGFQPELVTTFAEAQAALARGGFDACSTDLTLPNSDGLDVVAAAVSASVPVVVFTGHVDSALAYEARRHGAVDVFYKPETGPLAAALWREIRGREEAMSDPNATISPAKARKAGPLARFSKATREQAAVAAQSKAQAAATPVRSFFLGVSRKLGGVAAVVWGQSLLRDAAKVPGADKYVNLGLAVVVIVIGLMALMPDITMTVLRFFGLDGLVGKVLKRKTEEPAA